MAGYRDRHDELRAEGISVVALSADPLEKARETVDADHLPFPVAYDLALPDIADAIGAPWEAKRHIVQPSEFILGPDRKVISATYSSGPIGRVVAEDALGLIRFLKSRAKTAGS